jgi:PQQ-dependent dehydrogenase (methanol/ethanol family)
MTLFSLRLLSPLLLLSFVTGQYSLTQDWPMQGHDFSNQRYSDLKQITQANVSEMIEIGFYPASSNGARQQSVPVVRDGIAYVSVPNTSILALDLNSGKTLWTHEYEIDWHTTSLCCGSLNRGVAVDDQHVYIGGLNAQLIALDRKTGNEVWKVQSANPAEGYSFTMAPLVIDDKVIIGPSGGEFGIRGFLDAYDTRTGNRVWRFWTIPSPEQGGWYGDWVEKSDQGESYHRDISVEKANKDKYPDAWKNGGGPVWSTPAYDADSGLIYFGVGNPSPNIDDNVRPGDNLYTNSIVALDLSTGEYRWHYQLVPHDRWDYDASSPVVLHDFNLEDKTIKAISHASKTGWLYTWDRITGKLLSRSKNFVPQKNLYAQPTEQGIYIAPGARGGANWASPTYSPKTHFMYVMAMHLPMDFKRVPAPREAGKEWLGGEMFEREDEPGWGVLSAISPESGEIIWEHKSEQWLWAGGALSTAGGLVFYPEPSGNLVMLDQKTGEELWSKKINVHLNSAPITFMLNNKQVFVVSSNKGLHFFGLPDKQ